MQTSILTTKNLNANDFTFKYKNVDGKHQVYLRNGVGSIPVFWSPWLIAPFGVSSYMKSKGSTETLNDWTLDLKASCYQNLDLSKLGKTFSYEDNKEDIEYLLQFFNQLQEKAIDFAHSNSKNLFKREMKREIIEEACITKILKKTDKKDAEGNFYPDKFTTKIGKDKNGLPDIVVEDFEYSQTTFSSSENVAQAWLDLEDKLGQLVPKGTPLRAIIQLKPYFVNGKLGFSLKLCAIQLDDKKKNSGPIVYTFREGSREITPSLTSVPYVTSVPSVSSTPSTSSIIDEEEIEVEEEEEEIEVP
jgi:hypothetical protein